MVKVLAEWQSGQATFHIDLDRERLFKVRELDAFLKQRLRVQNSFQIYHKGAVLDGEHNIPLALPATDFLIAISSQSKSADAPQIRLKDQLDNGIPEFIHKISVANLFYNCHIENIQLSDVQPEQRVAPPQIEVPKRVKSELLTANLDTVPNKPLAGQKQDFIGYMREIEAKRKQLPNSTPKFLNIHKNEAAKVQKSEALEEGEIESPNMQEEISNYIAQRLTNKTSLESNILQRLPKRHFETENQSSIMKNKQKTEQQQSQSKPEIVKSQKIDAKRENLRSKIEQQLMESSSDSEPEEQNKASNDNLHFVLKRDNLKEYAPALLPTQESQPKSKSAEFFVNSVKNLISAGHTNETKASSASQQQVLSEDQNWEKIDFERLKGMSVLQLGLLFNNKPLKFRLVEFNKEANAPSISPVTFGHVTKVISAKHFQLAIAGSNCDVVIDAKLSDFFELFIDKKREIGTALVDAAKAPKMTFPETFKAVPSFKQPPKQHPQTEAKSNNIDRPIELSAKHIKSEGEGKAESLKKKVYKQVNYWFSDQNYPKDPFFEQHTKTADKSLNIDLLLSFPRMKRLTHSLQFLTQVLLDCAQNPDCNYELLEGKRIRKRGIAP